MRLVRKLDNYCPEPRGIVISIGNFDGLHRGHRAILSRLLIEAKDLELKSAVMCFEPQPLEYFKSDSPARLSRFRDKFVGFNSMNIDLMFCLNFNKFLANTQATDFITEILIKKLNIKKIIVGDDFRFGAQGKGNFKMLEQYGEQFGFKAESLASFLHQNDRISSTKIRELLKLGKLEEIRDWLGEEFSITGKVSHGMKLGRTIDYPTANINLNRQVVPLNGVYAVKVLLKNATWHNAMANVGSRPTVNGVEPKLEVHIFDFDDDLYHQEIKVLFIKKIREEKKFSSLQELKEQIKLDEDCAREILA